MRYFAIALAAIGIAVSAPAQAEWYFGAKTGPMMFDVNGVDDPTNTGIMAGYQIPVLIGDLGLEAEFTTTVSDGDIGGNKLDVDTQAAFLAFRTAGLLYVKAKTGYVNVDVNGNSDSDTAIGFGVGFGIGLLQLELEYTKISDDIDFVSVGVQF